MKYANGCVFNKGKQVYAFACAKSYKRMKEMLFDHFGTSSYEFDGWWSKCANDAMIEIAKDKEGIWVASSTQTRDYKKVN